MSVLTLYILRQIITPLVIATLTLSGIVWLLRALRELDKVVISGQSLGTWLELVAYTMPRVLEITLPPSFLLAVFYAFYRLFMDREIIIMFSAGISRTRLMRPVLLLALFVAALELVLGFYVAPWTNRMAQTRALEINANVASAMLQPGIFTNPTKGITAFVRHRDESGFIHGIFFQDERDPEKSISYTAESGALLYSNGQTTLEMFDGHIQHHDKTAPNGGITLVKFERYQYDLSQLARIGSASFNNSREQFPDQLYQLWVSDKTSEREKKDIFLFTHNLLLKVFYIIAYGFIVLAVFLPAQVSRQGYNKRITAAAAAAVAVSFSHFPIVDDAFNDRLYLLLMYLTPLLVAAAAVFISLRGVSFLARLKHRTASARASSARASSARASSALPSAGKI